MARQDALLLSACRNQVFVVFDDTSLRLRHQTINLREPPVSACVVGVDRELKKPCLCECRFAMLLAFILIQGCFPTRPHTSRPLRALFFRTGCSRCNAGAAMSAVCVEYSRRNGMCRGAGFSCSRFTSPAVQWSMPQETYPGWAGLSHHEDSWRTRSTLLAHPDIGAPTNWILICVVIASTLTS